MKFCFCINAEQFKRNNDQRSGKRHRMRVSRRIVTSLLVLSACAGGGSSSPNILRLALINDPILNPVLAPDVGSVLVNKVIFPGLVRPDEQLRPSPDLATSWTVSEDGKVYTFALGELLSLDWSFDTNSP